MGKPAIFNRIVYACPDVEMLLDHAVLTRLPNLIGGKHGKTGANPCTLENVWTLAQEKLRAGKLTAIQHDLIHLLFEIISTQDHYETLCRSLDMLPEYGPMAKPRYETWMMQTQATLIKFLCARQELSLQNGQNQDGI